MDGLAEFVASAVEFLVGGIIFSIAVAFLLTGGSIPQPSSEVNSLLTSNSGLVAAVCVGIAYAVGVAAESLSRGVFEFMLERVTLRSKAFGVADTLAVAGGPEVIGRKQNWLARRRDQLHERLLGTRPGAKDEPSGAPYTLQDCSKACKERERQRTVVLESERKLLNQEVQGQLKRLRLERVCTVSVAILVIALIRTGHWGFAALAAITSVWMVGLIHSRFVRYCNAIARSYERLLDSEGLNPSATATRP